MSITRAGVRRALDLYLDAYPGDVERLATARDLLEAGARVTSRDEFAGHVTAGAVVIDPAGRVLHVRHRVLDRWLMPGGHLEPADATLVDAAMRELAEATGVIDVEPLGEVPVDIDVHPIPANAVKGEPAHQHIDVRYVFRCAAIEVTLQVEEVTDVAWLATSDLASPRLRNRLSALAAR